GSDRLMQRAVIEPPEHARFAFAGEDETDDFVEPWHVGPLDLVEEALEAVVALGEFEHLGVRPAEVGPDFHDAAGGSGADVLDAVADVFGQHAREFVAHLVLGGFRLHLLGDDRQHAMAKVPNVLGNQDEADPTRDHRNQPAQDRADDALANPRRNGGKLAPHDQNNGAGNTLTALEQDLAGRHLSAKLGRIDADLAAGIGADGARHGRAVAPPKKRLHALNGRSGRIRSGRFDALADLAADP